MQEAEEKIQFQSWRQSIVNKILNKKWDKYTFINEERKGDHKWYINKF